MGSRAVALRVLGGMAAHFRFWQVENQPAMTDIRGRESELIPDEGREFLGLGGVEHRVNATDHRWFLSGSSFPYYFNFMQVLAAFATSPPS